MSRKITASLDEAVRLLSKWATDSTKVSAVLIVDGIAVSFDGFIAQLSPDTLVIAQRKTPSTNVIIGLGKVLTFNYVESQTQNFTSCLTMESATWKCLLYEVPT
jgi:hypothetical protein